MSEKMIAALARHELAQQAVARFRGQIGEALSLCPIDRKRSDWKTPSHETAELTDQATGKTKTHLWHAFQHREPSSCGWGEVGLGEDGIDDALSPGSEFECEHCLKAWQLIVARKEARQELGKAKRLIRHYGKQAMAILQRAAQ